MESSANATAGNRLQRFLNTHSINNQNLYRIQDKAKSTNSKYPVRMLGGDPDDAKWATRKSLVGDNGIVDGVGLAVAGPEYDDYVNRKRIETTGAEFKAWLTNNVDLSTPEKQEYYYNLFPFLRDDRLAEIDRQAALQKKMAEINIRGMQSEEDWFFVYGLQQGYIKVSDMALQDLWRETEVSGSYQEGLFSIVSKNLFPKWNNFREVKYQLPTDLNGAQSNLGGRGVWDYNQITTNIPKQ